MESLEHEESKDSFIIEEKGEGLMSKLVHLSYFGGSKLKNSDDSLDNSTKQTYTEWIIGAVSRKCPEKE